MRETPLVSVIVPIFNIETLISQCVESLLDQTYPNLEIILVDDGSTDSSGDICNSFEFQDARVSVLHKENGGLSDARNVGIAASSGEFIALVDGDDYVSPSYVEHLVSGCLENGVDLSVIGYKKVVPGGSAVLSTVDRSADWTVLERHDALEELFYQGRLTTSAWAKLYRRSLFKDISYPVGEIWEDLAVTYRLFGRVDRIAVSDAQEYFYVQHPASITAQSGFERRRSGLKFAAEAVEYVRETDPSLLSAAKTRQFMECVYVVSRIPNRRELRSLSPQLEPIVKATRGPALRSSAPLKQRVLAAVAHLGLDPLRLSMRAYSSISNRRFQK